MRNGQTSPLTETIYDAAVDSAAWADVMDLFKQRFLTRVEGFYFLDFGRRSLRPLHIGGVTDSYLRTFSGRYFTKDNPWTASQPLHRPGVI